MIKLALTSLLTGTLAFASTTMCFKKDHIDPSNIEQIPLDGGECKGMFSVADMKKQGYDVTDIKITMGQNGMDYIYVFAKETVVIGNSPAAKEAGAQVLTKEQLRMYLEDLKEEERVEEEAKVRFANIEEGKTFYIEHCEKCHGKKGELRAYGASRPLKDLTLTEMSHAILDYDLGNRITSTAVIMKPYAGMATDDRLELIGVYLKSLN